MRNFASLLIGLVICAQSWAQITVAPQSKVGEPIVAFYEIAFAQLALPKAWPNPEREDRTMAIVNEEWRAVQGYEGSYEVSNMGQVRSLPRTILRSDGRLRRFPGVVLKPGKNACKPRYLHITLCGESGHVTFEIHRLVAIAFHGCPPADYVCNHIDANPSNNNAENLEWVTQQGNVRHAMGMGLMNYAKGEQCPSARLSESQVRDIRARYAAGGTSHRKLAAEFGMSPSHIRNIVIGAKWSHLTEAA